MSLAAILEAIRKSGEVQVQAIENEAHRQVQEILAEARLDAKRITEEACMVEVLPATRERARIHHHARLESLQLIGSERKKLIDTILEQVRGYLAGFRSDSRYPEVLHKLMLEAVRELEGSLVENGSIRLEVDARDHKLLEKFVQEEGFDAEVVYNSNNWGGLAASSSDGQVKVINTLEGRLEHAIPFLRRTLAAYIEADENVDELELIAK